MLTRIGITGGIGSGKSEVCGKFSALGVPTVSADAIARQLTDSDPSIRKKIIARFGESAFSTDSGLLNRKFLAGIVFKNRESLLALNAIVHPAVINAIESAVTSLDMRTPAGYVTIEAALLFETQLKKNVDYILTIVVDESRRIDRLMKRGSLSEEQIRLRMTNQYPVDRAIEASDFVVYNNDMPEALDAKIQFLHTIFSTLKPRLKKKP